MYLVVTDGVDAPQSATPAKTSWSSPRQQAMDAELAERMPGIARYLAVCFPALRRFDVAVVRAGAGRGLEVTFAFTGSNVERLFQTPIEAPCGRQELLAAFACLEAELRTTQASDHSAALSRRAHADEQRRRLADLLERSRDQVPPAVSATWDRLLAGIEALDRQLAEATAADPLPARVLDLVTALEALLQALAECVAASTLDLRRSA
jgi:hypothetical protein